MSDDLVEVFCIVCGGSESFYANQAPAKDKYVCKDCQEKKAKEEARNLELQFYE